MIREGGTSLYGNCKHSRGVQPQCNLRCRPLVCLSRLNRNGENPGMFLHKRFADSFFFWQLAEFIKILCSWSDLLLNSVGSRVRCARSLHPSLKVFLLCHPQITSFHQWLWDLGKAWTGNFLLNETLLLKADSVFRFTSLVRPIKTSSTLECVILSENNWVKPIYF